MRFQQALTLWRCCSLIGLSGRIVPCHADYCLIFHRALSPDEAAWVGSAMRFALGESVYGPG